MVFDIIPVSKKAKFLIVLLSIFLIALSWYLEKTKIIPQYSPIFYDMGLNCENKCDLKKQLAYFQKAVRHNPNLSDAYYQIALIYEKKGNNEKSLEFLRRVARLDHKNALAAYKLGVHHFKSEEYELARRYFLQSYRLKDCPEDATYYLGMISDRLKDYNSAIIFFKSMIVINDTYAPKIYPRLAELYYLTDGEYHLRLEVGRLRGHGNPGFADLLEQKFEALKESNSLINN